MTECCSIKGQVSESNESNEPMRCPSCMVKGKKVKLITIKSFVKPTILDSINPDLPHYFCSTIDCNVVYFDNSEKTYYLSDVKVPVHQKDISQIVPICYCFNWTKEKIKESVEDRLTLNPLEHIRENIKENRCGCEVNNPQGSCCLGNVTEFINQLSQEDFMDYCEEIRKMIGNTPLIVVRPSVAIMNEKGEILLNRYTGGTQGIPGGILQLNESVEECIKRNAQEDLGVTLNTLLLFGVYSGKE